ncbi:T9SS type A sorting domain-containing protein [Flavobacterium foetidum]|uniref:T9SS type A sorting domain-containing protein n=1 Tax=Flavobacterium foetidum TaxID=2026681 RepID=UPI0010753168|nr:T9SS type A sorting domain-containing protein [Flavobacterium foetidum]KAF2517835.1 T9SS type A sorting domain-containing protein [Flavobacterium foetidum]
MKKHLLKLFLFISVVGYSQQAEIGELNSGARKVTFKNPSAIEVIKVSEIKSNISDPNAANPADGKIIFTISGGTPATSGNPYKVTLKKGTAEIALSPTNYSINYESNKYKVTVTGLDEGTYTAIVEDNNNCISPSQPNFIITKQATMIVNKIDDYYISCYGNKAELTQQGVLNGIPFDSGVSYIYQWYKRNSDGSFTENQIGEKATNLGEGIYKLVVTDKFKNKGESALITVTERKEIIVVKEEKISVCKGETGSITLTISNVSSNCTIEWLNKTANGVVSNGGRTLTDISGNYSYKITDNGCTITGNALIDEPLNELVADFASTQPTSANNDGVIKIINLSGGNYPSTTINYTYNWSKEGDTAFIRGNVSQINGLSTGTYYVTITSSSGCQKNLGPITLEALNIKNYTQQNVKCYGAETGSLSIAVSGGTTLLNGYKYKWYKNGTEIPSMTTNEITGVGAGSYRVEVSDDNTSVNRTFTIANEPSEALSATSTFTDVICYEESNGTITLNIKGGISPYTVVWKDVNDASKNVNATQLPAGTYSYVITDQNGCTFSSPQNITISQKDQILISSIGQKQPTLFSANNGEITINAIGGTGSYTYILKKNNISTPYTTSPVTGLGEGVYEVSVKDANNCITAVQTITLKALAVAFVDKTNVSCYGGNNGNIEVLASGGTPISPTQYTYQWFYKQNATDAYALLSSQTTSKAVNLYAGFYKVIVTDNANISRELEIAELTQRPAIACTATKTDVSCFNGSNGTISLNITGGTGAYTVTWEDVNDTARIVNPSQLTAGSYTYSIKDANGCVFPGTTIVITQPLKPLTISSFTKIDANGFGRENGSIQITASDGTPSYTYQWYKGTAKTIMTGKTGPLLTGIGADSYTVIITDSKLCILEQTYTITEPDKLEVESLTQTPNTNILCNGDASAEYNIVVKGGVKGYSFEWLNNSTGKKHASTEVVGTTSTSSKASNLEAGNYTISVKDQHNNDLFGTNTFTITEPEVLAFSYTPQHVSCHGGNNGTITLNITGGTKNSDNTKPYTIVSNGGTINNQTGVISSLQKGSYIVKVIDANGCQTGEQVIQITEPAESVQITNSVITPTTGFGLSTGKVVVTVLGGTSGYTYQWKNSLGTIVGTNSPTLNNVPADTYTLLVTDSKGCPTGDTYIIPQPTRPALTETHSQAKCNGLFGSLNATATGGASYNQNQAARSYTYKFRNKATGAITTITGNTANFTNIADGDYSLTATDIAGVDSNTIDVLFQQPTPVIVNLASKIDVSCYGGQDGSIAVTVTGGTPFIVNGTPEYTYIWKKKNPATNLYENFTPTSLNTLYEGVYAVEVRDANYNPSDATHCVGLLSDIIISQPADFGFEIDRMTYQNPTAANGNDGALHFEIKGGKTNYEYKLYKKDALGNETVLETISNTSAKMVDFTGLIKDHYYVSVQDDTGCTKYTDFDFTDNPLTITISQTQVLTCFESNNGILKAVVNGGFGTKTISWYRNNVLLPNEHNAELLNVKIGNYYAVVKDTKAIEVTTAPLTVTQPDLVTFSTIQEPVKCLGDSNGTITITAAGGNGIFRYRYFNNGTLVQDWTNFANAASTIITGLADGEYTLQVQDTQQCASTDATVKITSPTALEIINIVAVPATGKGLSNGSISTTAQGANGSYSYNWFKADGSAINQTTANAVNLAAGKYYITVIDAKGCMLSSHLIEVTEPPLLETSISVQNVVLCNGDKNGSLRPTTTGGLLKPGENYTYQWFESGNTNVLSTSTILTNIGKGSYYVIAKDSNGNLATSQTLIVTEPEVLTNVLTADYVRCGDFEDWTIDATPTGGTLPYSYSWNNGAKTASIQNVKPGNYSVVVTDNHGCSITKSITLTAPAHLDAAEVIKIPTCYEGSDATITVTPIAGTAPYTYLWNTGEKTNKLSNAAAGDYSVEITDARGCIILRKYTIVNPPKDVINLGEDVTLCYKQSLTINGAINDDKATYVWTSDKGFKSTNPIITVSEPANYTLVVTNKLGCQATDTINVSSQESDISAEFAMSSQVFVNEKFIIIDISNPKADKVEWKLPAEAVITTNNGDYAEMSFTKAGEYDITINTQKGRCTAYQTKTIVVTEGEYEDPDDTDLQKKFDVKIYPNPSNGIFTVDATLDKVMSASVKIYNLNNNVVLDSRNGNGKDAYSFNFSLSGLSSGIYFVLFESQQGTKLRKLIIQ